MAAVTWHEAREIFDFGDLTSALVDVFVFGTDVRDYQKLIDLIRSRPDWAHSYLEDREGVPMPPDAHEIFARARTAQCDVWIYPSGLSAHGYFNFGSDRIEFDLDPDDLNSEDRFLGLIDMATAFGRTLAKPVTVAPEGLSTSPLLRYDPESGDVLTP